MEKIWVLTTEERDFVETDLYRSKESAMECVKGDLLDRYHFDTDEPYITKEELQEKQEQAENELNAAGWWQDDEVTYYLEEKEIND